MSKPFCRPYQRKYRRNDSNHLKKEKVMAFRHDCPEWDYMEIDESDAEFMMCRCYGGNRQARNAQDRLWDEQRKEYLLNTEEGDDVGKIE